MNLLSEMPPYTNNFNVADTTDISADFDSGYTDESNLQIVGNKVRGTNTTTYAIESLKPEALNVNPDQYAEIGIATFTGASLAGAAIVLRAIAPATKTYYICWAFRNNGGEDTRIEKFVSGTQTIISQGGVTAWATGDKLLGRVIGSDLVLSRIPSGQSTPTPIVTVSDGAIALGRVGLATFTLGAVTDVEIDDFIAGDFLPEMGIASKSIGAVRQQITAGFAS